jgi:hypothetical protein
MIWKTLKWLKIEVFTDCHICHHHHNRE